MVKSLLLFLEIVRFGGVKSFEWPEQIFYPRKPFYYSELLGHSFLYSSGVEDSRALMVWNEITVLILGLPVPLEIRQSICMSLKSAFKYSWQM